MRYMKPTILAIYPAVSTIQQIGNAGVKPQGSSFDLTHNKCTPSGYDADE